MRQSAINKPSLLMLPKRVLVVVTFLTISIILIIVRLFSVMLSGTSVTDNNTAHEGRGTITDRNGRILAIEAELDSVTAWTPHVTLPEDSADLLAEIVDINRAQLLQQLSYRDRFVTIKRHISLTQSQQIATLQRDGRLNGITLTPSAGRIYPEQRLASSVIGYVGVDRDGLGGIEYSMNDILQSSSSAQDDGNHIELTIDINLQSYIENIAEQARNTERADAVIAIVMDAKSGELLASISLPNFDPNSFSNFSDEQRRNRAISHIYEPGSVFKIFSLAAIIDNDGVNARDTFDTRRGYRGRFENYQISDVRDHGIISAAEIIAFSSNIGAALASDTIDRQQFYRSISHFGFGQKTGIRLNGEQEALFSPLDTWTERTKPTIAIGQEIGVTAIQMVTAATAIANDGSLLRPHIIRRIIQPHGESSFESAPAPVRQVISHATARHILTMMARATAPGGTARLANIDGYSIAAKTGTAEVYDPAIDAYSPDHFVASTLAIFPYNDPQYIVYMVIDYPKSGQTYGGLIVAPRVRKIIEYIISYRGVAHDNIIEYEPTIALPPKKVLPAFENIMPSLIGLPKQSVLPLLADERFIVRMHGNGYVVHQSPSAGSAVARGDTIVLRLQ